MRVCLTMLLCWGVAGAMPPVPRIILPQADAPAAGKPMTDAEALADRIARESRAAGDDLGAEQTGPTTRARQQQVKEDLDALIKLLEKPPSESKSSSSSSSSSQSQSQSQSDSKSNSSSKGDSQNKSERQQPQGNGPMPPPMGSANSKPQTAPMPGNPKQQAGSPSKHGEDKMPAGLSPGEKATGKRPVVTLPLEESIARDFWGHLPDVPRQRMLQFFREQYLPKYRDILGDYYQSLSEKEKPAGK